MFLLSLLGSAPEAILCFSVMVCRITYFLYPLIIIDDGGELICLFRGKMG